MQEIPARNHNRLPGLDGLRAISVALVIFLHLGSMSYFPRAHWLHAVAEEGLFGVQIFFVISGFLITWLLLAEEKKRGRIDLGKFYIRRALRILPPALLFLLTLKLLDAFGIVEVGWRDVLYAMLFVRNVLPGPILTNHYWSLAIEEQFYLGWPFLVVLLPSRGRLLVIISMIVARTGLALLSCRRHVWIPRHHPMAVRHGLRRIALGLPAGIAPTTPELLGHHAQPSAANALGTRHRRHDLRDRN